MDDEISLEHVAALAEKLSSADRRQLAEKLLRRLAEEQSGHPALSWKDAAGAGAAFYPICGEDAQQWVTRSRQEDDQQRQEPQADTMTVDDALRGVTRLFLDTAPVIYHIERHARYAPVVDEIFTRIDSGALPAVTSPVTLAECLVGPIRSNQAQLQQVFDQLIFSGRGVTFYPVEDVKARYAAQVRALHNLSLTDATQVAVAIAASCDALLTNDRAFRRIPGLRVILIDDLQPTP